MLLNGDVDFAITFPPLSGADIESRILIQDPIYLVIAGGHPLLRQATIYLRDLEQYELISLTADNPFASYCDELLSKKNVALSFRRVGYSKLMAIIDRERNQGKLLGLSSRKQFASWFGAGYRCLRIEDFNESLMTAVSWRKESSFAYEYKGLIKELEEDYDRIYYRNYSIMDPE
ncbi:MAG: LysR family transcriptional regulator substrate-binding protein [Lachnospiraceae bacterium]|nr:LysR family transcriptional regulator substrate-binding protein [Lachnospiraceae bacterium]